MSAPEPSETKEHAGEAPVKGFGLLVMLLVFLGASILALYTIWVFWPPEASGPETTVAAEKRIDFFFGLNRTVSRETLFFVIVAVAGALGGMVHVLRSLSWYAGNRLLKWSWIPFYLLRPLLGAAMATLLYFVVRAGFFSPSSSTTQASPYGFAALAALSGLFSDHAAEKLKRVAAELFQEPPQGKDTVAAEPEVTVGPVKERRPNEAIVVGEVNPKGKKTTFTFEWGDTTEYGNRTPEPPGDVGEGLTPKPVTATLGPLDPARSYHYRLVATSEDAVTYSADQLIEPFRPTL
jgi:hypothetical protein